jgi:alkanesulfonate monooxygenase SsuD/methylene tetrahydromethanopterin reductase-like flavin-dependent oxidoreductase (luciferase family)
VNGEGSHPDSRRGSAGASLSIVRRQAPKKRRGAPHAKSVAFHTVCGDEPGMKVGITLPGMIPGTSFDTVLDWARRADAGPFSSVAIGERLLWPGYDLMVTLAAAAAVTQRVRIVSTVVVLPLHSAVVIAKKAASLDALSHGRLTLGIGIGGRDDDFRAVGAAFAQRHDRMEEQVAMMRRIWRGEPPAQGLAHIGPRPLQAGGPEVIVGSVSPAAVRRVARWADGLSAWSFQPNVPALAETYRVMREAWSAAGRSGAPRLVAGFWYGLGDDAGERVGSFVRKYLAYFGTDSAAQTARSVRTVTPQRIKDTLAALADLGTDEVIPVPVSGDIEQLDRLAELIA